MLNISFKSQVLLQEFFETTLVINNILILTQNNLVNIMLLFSNLEDLAQSILDINDYNFNTFIRRGMLSQGYSVRKKRECSLEEIKHDLRQLPISGSYDGDSLEVHVEGNVGRGYYPIFMKSSDISCLDGICLHYSTVIEIKDHEEVPESFRDSGGMHVIIENHKEFVDAVIVWKEYSVFASSKAMFKGYSDQIYIGGYDRIACESIELDGCVKDYSSSEYSSSESGSEDSEDSEDF